MKVRQVYGSKVMEVADALTLEMTGESERGAVEQLEADVDAMRNLLAKFIAQHVRTVDDLNRLTSYREYVSADF